MKRHQGWVAAGLAAAVSVVAFVGVGSAQQREARSARPTRIAVIELEKVFSSLKEKTQIDADLKTRQAKVVKEEEDRKKELGQLDEELRILNASSPAFRDKQDEAERKLAEYKAWGQWQMASVKRDNRLLMIDLYRKIQKSVAEFAKQQEYDLVLFKESDDLGDVAQADDARGAIRGRKVLYASPDLDVSDQVIQLMNNQYQNSTGGKAPAGPAPASAGTRGTGGAATTRPAH